VIPSVEISGYFFFLTDSDLD